jgi:hypothetical protein
LRERVVRLDEAAMRAVDAALEISLGLREI